MLELAASTAADPARRLSSLKRLGHLCLLQGDPAAGATHLTRAARSATAIGDAVTAVEARVEALGALVEIGEESGESLRCELGELASEALRLGRLSTYLAVKDLTIRVADYGFDASSARAALLEVDRLDVGSEPSAVQCLRETIRTRHVCYGNPEEAVAAARTALRIAEENDLSSEFGRAVKRFLVVLGYRGLLDGNEGRRLVEDAKVGFRRTGNQSGLFDVLINFGVWLADTGRFTAAEEYLQEAGTIVRNLEDAPEHAVFLCNMGELHLYRADYLTAKRYFRRAWEKGKLTRRK
jgi:tetratricopeptide (TPR) repeat protein